MLKRNIIANYFGQAYAALAAVFAMGIFAHFVPATSYGLLPLYFLVNAAVFTLSNGVAPVLARYVAVFRGEGRLNSSDFERVEGTLQCIIVFFSAVTFFFIALFSEFLVEVWRREDEQSDETLHFIFLLMAASVSLRWFSALYSSGLIGLEKQVVLNCVSIIMVSLQWVGGGSSLWLSGGDLVAFFSLQVCLVFVEAASLFIIFRSSIRPGPPRLRMPRFYFAEWIRLRVFTLSAIYTSAVWVAVAQYDKIVVAAFMEPDAYGALAFSALLANLVVRSALPLNQAFLPRLTVLIAKGDADVALISFRRLTAFVSVLSFSTGAVFFFLPEYLLNVFSFQADFVSIAAEFLAWFAIGNVAISLASLLAVLQSANGNLKYQVVGSTISLFIQVPIITLLAIDGEILLMVYFWAIFRFFVFLIIAPRVFSQFGIVWYRLWLLHDIAVPALGAVLGAMSVVVIMDYLREWLAVEGSFENLIFILLASCFILLSSSLCSSPIRCALMRIISSRCRS